LPRPSATKRVSTEISVLLGASTLAALVMWTIDLVSWRSVRHPIPFLVGFVFALAIGGGLGLGLLCLWAPLRALGARSKWRTILPLPIVGALVALAAKQSLGSLPWTRTHPLPAFALVGCVSAVTTVLVSSGFARLTQDAPKRSWFPWAPLAAVAGVLLFLDQTILSTVFEKPYSFIEGVAHVAATLALAGALRKHWRRAIPLALVAVTAFTSFVASRRIRVAVERSLPAVWEEPLFTARWLRRMRRLEAVRADVARTDLDRLGEKYSLDRERSAFDAWASPQSSAPTPLPVENAASSVIVFFVDALRADVAHDPAVMPDTLAWMQANTWFPRTYASGSSTLLTLAPMLGCRYDTTPEHRPLLLDAARAAGLKTALFIPKTARDYHYGAFPTFRFEHEDVIPDFDSQRIPTAMQVVDHALEWLEGERPERFFLWAYQFDAHGWSDLDESYVEGHANEGGFSKTEGLHWRYRAAVRGLDQAFTRLRAGLEALGLAERTTIAFVSDHGEALGQQNFWAHSTYLWESLIRVPLAIQVPGAPARSWDTPVSTVDLAPTLARTIGLPIDSTSCHGQDLLGAGDATTSHPPILFSAMTEGEVVRLGLLGDADRKLVVDLRNADARLLRIGDGAAAPAAFPAVEEDVSLTEPGAFNQRLHELLRAPIFPH
jgi:hypothetical protein